MHRILLLGYSSIAQKSIIPALRQHPSVRLSAIASRSGFHRIPKIFEVFDDYKKAIDTARCDTVYVSLHNSAHFQWIMYALENGKNIICDKPVVLSARDARAVVRKAAGKQIIFEATQYLYHPAHTTLTQLIHAEPSPLQHISLQFGYPKLPTNNFRNDATLGGGCIFDIGPYVVSTGEHYFGKIATDVCAFVDYKQELPVAAAITFRFGNKQTLQAAIGFDREYQNRLELWGNGFHFALGRAFTMPPDFRNAISVKQHDKTTVIPIRASDSFADMFTYYHNLKPNEYYIYNKRLLQRLTMLDAISFSGKHNRQHHLRYR